jgi:predicted Kef-type K+ transport protein
MGAIWVVTAYLLGFVARQVGLPPLIGFLVAGFVLHAFGVRGGEFIQIVSNLGIYLLLFSIGLKLDLRSLARPQIWGVAGAHVILTTVGLGAVVFGLAAAGISIFTSLDFNLALLVAFALSYSSTVFAVKVFEEKGEMSSLHGRTAIGILIMQDLFAVVFLTVSSGKLPSPWALLLLAVPLMRPLIIRLLQKSGHGELLVLLGLILALGGAELFGAFGLKPDLGPLVMGVLIAGCTKANELAKILFGFKELFLTGFFLSIGLSGLPGVTELAIAVLLVAFIPLKTALFLLLLTRSRLRARTSLLASLSLANYSEFGLIVGGVGVASGWIGSEWLVIIAIAMSISFVLASPINAAASAIYLRWTGVLRRFETTRRLPEEMPIEPGEAIVMVAGMGRVGTGAYQCMCRLQGDVVVGVDSDREVVGEQTQAGRNVVFGDVTDCDFWDRARLEKIRVVLLTMPSQNENLTAIRLLEQEGFRGFVAATAQFPDEVDELKAAGADAAFNFYAQAGTGLAQFVSDQLGDGLKAG